MSWAIIVSSVLLWPDEIIILELNKKSTSSIPRNISWYFKSGNWSKLRINFYLIIWYVKFTFLNNLDLGFVGRIQIRRKTSFRNFLFSKFKFKNFEILNILSRWIKLTDLIYECVSIIHDTSIVILWRQKTLVSPQTRIVVTTLSFFFSLNAGMLNSLKNTKGTTCALSGSFHNHFHFLKSISFTIKSFF